MVWSSTAIHPAQIAVIHKAQQPSADDAAWAQQVIAELQDGARSSGRVRGSMVDLPHLNAARRIQSAVNLPRRSATSTKTPPETLSCRARR